MTDTSSEDEIRAALTAALAGLGAGTRSRMGAGSDDVAGPREYLRALAPGGWIVPGWPARVRRPRRVSG